MNLIPKRRLGDIPTLRDNTVQDIISKVKGLNLDWANIKNVTVTNAQIVSLDATKITSQIVNAQIATIEYAKITNVAVVDAQITNCSITKLTAGNLAVTGILTTGGYLKSTNYVADTSGWQIDYLGNAEFNTVKVRGSIYTSSIVSGNTLTVTGTISAGAGKIILDSTGMTVDGQLLTFKYGATAVGYVWGFGAAQFNVTAATNMNLYVGAASGQLFLVSSSAYSVDVAGLSLDASDCLYFDVPRRTSAPTAAEGRMYYQFSGVTRFYGYSAGAWRLLDYTP